MAWRSAARRSRQKRRNADWGSLGAGGIWGDAAVAATTTSSSLVVVVVVFVFVGVVRAVVVLVRCCCRRGWSSKWTAAILRRFAASANHRWVVVMASGLSAGLVIRIYLYLVLLSVGRFLGFNSLGPFFFPLDGTTKPGPELTRTNERRMRENETEKSISPAGSSSLTNRTPSSFRS
jgi:hypothetical protein